MQIKTCNFILDASRENSDELELNKTSIQLRGRALTHQPSKPNW